METGNEKYVLLMTHNEKQEANQVIKQTNNEIIDKK